MAILIFVFLATIFGATRGHGYQTRWKNLDNILQTQAKANLWSGIVHATQGKRLGLVVHATEAWRLSLRL